MNFETINQAMGLVSLERAERIAAWQQEIGPPAKEIVLKLDDDDTELSSITYGLWKFDGPTNPDFVGANEPFIMLVEKAKNGFSPERARYFPLSLVKAMFDLTDLRAD